MNELVISGLGMVSSVGRDVVTACAAIRAGVSRPSEIDYFEVVDPETQDMLPVNGHPIKAFSDGFNLVGLWLRLARSCISDLALFSGILRADEHFWRRTGLVGVTPRIGGDRFLLDEDEPIERVVEAFVDPLCRSAGLAIPDEQRRVAWGGHNAAIAAFRLAHELLEGQQLERVIVVAVDSLLDTLALEWLANDSRIKTPDCPNGLAPGEACAAFLVERQAACLNRGGAVQARLAGFGFGHEENHFHVEAPNMGKGLTQAIRLALEKADLDSPFCGDIVSDLNGEDWRAVELAHARMALRDRIQETAPVVLPSLSLGDVGAASAAVQICVSARSFARGYAAADSSMVVASSDDGDTGALLLRAPA